jgi:hypothetical protein
MKTRLEMIKAARALLARRGGWVQGTEFTDNLGRNLGRPQFCMIGAIRSCSVEAGSSTLYNSLMALVSAELPIGYYSIPFFNDAYSRKKYEVIAVFDRVITKLEQHRRIRKRAHQVRLIKQKALEPSTPETVTEEKRKTVAA